MPKKSSVMMTGAAMEIGASYVGRVAEWCQDLVLIARDLLDARKQKRVDHLLKRFANENVDEMLCDIPSAAVTGFWNTTAPSIEHLNQKMASPFGDW
jgi:short-subunit dehydrogenase